MFIIPAILPECKAKRRISQKRLSFLKVWFKDNWQIWESNAFSIYTRETANTRSVHSGGRSPGDCHHQRLVFFAIDKPLVLEHEVAFKLIHRLHA